MSSVLKFDQVIRILERPGLENFWLEGLEKRCMDGLLKGYRGCKDICGYLMFTKEYILQIQLLLIRWTMIYDLWVSVILFSLLYAQCTQGQSEHDISHWEAKHELSNVKFSLLSLVWLLQFLMGKSAKTEIISWTPLEVNFSPIRKNENERK